MNEPTFKCTIRGDLFARAMTAASTEETQYYLGGVYVTPAPKGGAYLVATNGHFLLCLWDKSAAIEGSAIVKLPGALLNACAGKRGGDTTLSIEGGQASVEGLAAGGVLVDGTYPDWKRVIPAFPDTAQGVTATFATTAVLAPLAKALSPGVKGPWLRIVGEGQSPHWCFGSDPDAFGIAMPVRDSGRPSKPEWYEPAAD